jgi:hypothetical protein
MVLQATARWQGVVQRRAPLCLDRAGCRATFVFDCEPELRLMPAAAAANDLPSAPCAAEAWFSSEPNLKRSGTSTVKGRPENDRHDG